MTKEYMVVTYYILYTTSAFHCPYCIKAKELLDVYGVEYVIRDINIDGGAREEFLAAGHTKVPQIYREGVLIGGSDKLQKHLRMTLVRVQEEKEIERKVKF
jgi:glutaredoxin 3